MSSGLSSCNGYYCLIRDKCKRYKQFVLWQDGKYQECRLIIADYNHENNECKDYKPIDDDKRKI